LRDAAHDAVRQVGLVAGIELVKNWRTREPFALRERAGIRVFCGSDGVSGGICVSFMAFDN